MAAISLLAFGLGFGVYSLMNQLAGEDNAKAFLHGFFKGFRESTDSEWVERLSPFLGILWLLIASQMMGWKRRMDQPKNNP
jgi:hypothetical protein